MSKKIPQLWARQGKVEIFDVGWGYYVVRFKTLADQDRACFGGPWMVSDHYIVMQNWRPYFRPEDSSLSTLRVWIRLPGLPLEYFDASVLTTIGNRIGKTIRIDHTTLQETHDLGRYLGVPILHGRVTKHTYDFILDRLDNRLAGWKAENLSLAGRVTLAMLVLNSIPCYIMQTAFLPVSLCDKIDRRIRGFIWGSKDGARKIHNVNWETVCRPKSLGGLGLRSARDLNKAFLMKLVWNLMSQPDELWVRVLLSKYMVKTANGYMLARKKGFSNAWRGMMRVWDITQNGVRWSIRDGRSTRFWTDRWLDSGILLIDYALNIREVDVSNSVADFCDVDKVWDLDKLRNVLPENIVLQVYGMSTPREGSGGDSTVWGLENDGRFSVKSAYCLIKDFDPVAGSSIWNKVWRWEGPNRVRHFLWLVTHGKIMTNVERARRRLTDDTGCTECSRGAEDIEHVLRSCPFAQLVWSRVLPEIISTEKMNEPFDQWWSSAVADCRVNPVFGLSSWIIWRRRNQRVFEDVTLSVDEVVGQISFWAQLLSSSWKAHQVGREAPRYARQTLLIGWRLGDEGWYTLNTDGSLIPTTSSAAAGGVIRDDQGRFVLAFSSNLGSCSIVRAEIWAILEGMVLAWDKGIRKLRIQTDSVSAVQLLTDMRGLLHKHSNLVNLFQDYKSRPWEVSIEHIFREANNAADFLANSGHQLDLGTTVFDLPCPTLLNWLRYDLISVCLPRRVNNIS
ncbi:Putative ribonuclease H protein At1g65750 [Linum perenne]